MIYKMITVSAHRGQEFEVDGRVVAVIPQESDGAWPYNLTVLVESSFPAAPKEEETVE